MPTLSFLVGETSGEEIGVTAECVGKGDAFGGLSSFVWVSVFTVDEVRLPLFVKSHSTPK